MIVIFLGFLLCEHTLMGILIMTVFIGTVRSWLLVPQPIVIIEDVSIKKFASAYGIYGIITGFVSVVCGAIVGEMTNIILRYEFTILQLCNLNFHILLYIYM